MQLGRNGYVNAVSSVVYAIVDSVVEWRGRRHIHHVPAKRDVIGYNNFASWIIVDTYIVMLMRLQVLCKSCMTSCYYIILYFIADGRATELSKLILLYRRSVIVL